MREDREAAVAWLEAQPRDEGKNICIAEMFQIKDDNCGWATSSWYGCSHGMPHMISLSWSESDEIAWLDGGVVDFRRSLTSADLVDYGIRAR